jgi:hypothetical protein
MCGSRVQAGSGHHSSISHTPVIPLDDELGEDAPWITEDLLASLPPDLVIQGRLIGSKPLRALQRNQWNGAEIECFVPVSTRERVEAVAKKQSRASVGIDGGRLTVVPARVKRATISTAVDLALAIELLLRFRSALAPASKPYNAAIWDKFSSYLRCYDWDIVRTIFEQTRVYCEATNNWDWSISWLEAEHQLLRAPRLDSGALSTPVHKAKQSKDEQPARLSSDEYQSLLKQCNGAKLCLRFQLDKCNATGDHKNGLRHACASCSATDHGSRVCSAELSPSESIKARPKPHSRK